MALQALDIAEDEGYTGDYEFVGKVEDAMEAKFLQDVRAHTLLRARLPCPTPLPIPSSFSSLHSRLVWVDTHAAVRWTSRQLARARSTYRRSSEL